VEVQVSAAGPADRACLAALMQLYAYDLSEPLGLELRDDGTFPVPAIEACLSDPRCHPFLLRADERLAGFALVARRSWLDGDERVCDVAEFFVLRRYRRLGVGEHAARWLFDRYRGPWEVRQRRENSGASAFWRRTIGRYTDGQFEEVQLDEPRWRGPVQRFDSSTAGP
jgi:predicted acetyltransferase